ncbi:tripeptidyl-peptidase II Tpp2 [Nowakowskiella sp. JEL0407]|nr:tripeptidyl-peptidase II Tpp2 [Nowakowskiella sp. JEL0407]
MDKQKEFPVDGLLPKLETQAASFIAKNPKFDGRGTLIAILDTGVDPKAPGLSVTTDGKRKILDCIDCTGSGDIIMSALITPTPPTETEPFYSVTSPYTNQLLRLRKDWDVSKGVRIGLKKIEDLYTKDVLERVWERRKKRDEIEEQGLLASKGADDKEEKERIEILKDLKKGYKQFSTHLHVLYFEKSDFPVVAVDTLDTGDFTVEKLIGSFKETGDIGCFKEDSGVNFTWSFFEKIEEQGKDKGGILSLVTCAGAHGTHVAAITSANFPSNPELNGVAPGAQLISLKIGDTRLGSMETGTGLIRAIRELRNWGVDLVNMSYGEAAVIGGHNIGRIAEEIETLVNEKNVIFTSSAGNDGPALSTIGAPNSLTGSIIGVGAYVLKDMVDADYALIDQDFDGEGSVHPGIYTWSSRGPTHDGDLGHTIYAPGAAITSVPQYTKQSSQLMNGTSMACPNLCGCLALIASGLKATGISYTAYAIKTALLNTAKDIGNEFGVGFIQVEKVWEYLGLLLETRRLDYWYKVRIVDRNNARGIYLRTENETRSVVTSNVEVEPIFPCDGVIQEFDLEETTKPDVSTQSKSVLEPNQNFETISKLGKGMEDTNKEVDEKKLSMDIWSTLKVKYFKNSEEVKEHEEWIKVPEFVVFGSKGRTFTVIIDSSRLPTGFHYAEIQGYDSQNLKYGVLFRVPVVICKPEIVSEIAKIPSPEGLGWEKERVVEYEETFGPGSIKRKFISIPEDCNFVDIEIKSKNREIPARFVLHTLQLQSQSRYTKHEYQTYALISKSSQLNKTIPVLPSTTLELCLAQFWSSANITNVSMSLKFHGVFVNTKGVMGGTGGGGIYCGGGLSGAGGGGLGSAIWMSGGAGCRADVIGMGKEDIGYSVNIDSLRKFIRPTESKIQPLKSRDIIGDSLQLFEAVLTYSFKAPDGGGSVVPRFPKFNDMLYDSPVENFCFIVFDSTKRSISFQDIYPKPITLTDGTFTLRAQIVSKSYSILEKLLSTQLVLDISIKLISIPTYAYFSDTITTNPTNNKKKNLQRSGDSDVVWIPALEDDKYPKNAKVGDLLLGKFGVLGDRKIEKGGNVAVVIVVPPSAPKEDNGGSSKPGSTEEKDEEKELKEAIRDLEIAYLKKMKDGEVRRKHREKLEKEYSGHLPLKQAILEVLVKECAKNDGDCDAEKIQDIINQCNAIIEQCDVNNLAMYYGVKTDLTSDAAKTKKAEMEKLKEALLGALSWKTWAYKQLVLLKESKKEDSTECLTSFDDALAQYAQWISSDPPTNDGRYLLQWAWRQRRKSAFVVAVKAVHKYLEDKKNTEVASTVGYAGEGNVWKKLCAVKVQLFDDLGWNIWKRYEEKWNLSRNMNDWAPF